jgi:sugar/nucleoside kinase (ribokinase family)
MKPTGLFIGRSVVDVINVVNEFPVRDGKVSAQQQLIVSGGSALNAAITFAHLGGKAFLYSTFGSSLFGRFAKDECENYGVSVIDRASEQECDFPVSCIISARATSSRCVINSPLIKERLPIPSLDALCLKPDIILLDQFESDAVVYLEMNLKNFGVPIVLDGGSWKENTPLFLGMTTIPIVSAHFVPPDSDDKPLVTVTKFMKKMDFSQWAMTQGASGVHYCENGKLGQIDPIPIEAIDTLGAGDIFHGAFCFALTSKHDFISALRFANIIAAESCKYPGTRKWMTVNLGQ